MKVYPQVAGRNNRGGRIFSMGGVKGRVAAWLEGQKGRGTGMMEGLEGRQMLSAVPDWLNTLGSAGTGDFDFSYNSVEGVASDASDNVYVVGQYRGTMDFDPGAGVTSLTATYPGGEGFVAKYNANGTLAWVRRFAQGGTGGVFALSQAKSVALDDLGNVYVGGTFTDKMTVNFGAGATSLTSQGGSDIFVAKITDAGALTYLKGVGGEGEENFVEFIGGLDGGMTFVGGSTGSVDLDPGAGTVSLAAAALGGSMGFVAHYATDFTFQEYVAVRGTGTGGTAQIFGATNIGAQNLLVMTGKLQGSVEIINSGGKLGTMTGPESADGMFVASLDVSEGAMKANWSKVFSGTGDITAGPLRLDQGGNVYVGVNVIGSVDLDLGAGTAVVKSSAAGVYVPVIFSLSSAGAYRWSASAGAEGEVRDLVVFSESADPGAAKVVAVGSFAGTANFDPAGSASGQRISTVQSGFVWELNGNGGYMDSAGFYTDPLAPVASSNRYTDVRSVSGTKTGAQGLILGGVFAGTVDFDGTSATKNAASVSNGFSTDGFVGRFTHTGVSDPGTQPTTPGADFHVTGNGVHIEFNDTTPATGDGTNFGTVAAGSAAVSHTFLVTNLGKVDLKLGSVSLPEGFTLTEGLSSVIAPGKTDSFKVTMSTDAAAVFAGELSFSTNMAGFNPFKFVVFGNVTAVTAPGVKVSFEGAVISDGDTSPVMEDGTSFVTVNQGGAASQRTYSVTNTGSADLKLGTPTLPSGFALVEGLTATLAPGASDTFTVALKTGTAGTFFGDISVGTNVTGKNPFNFKVQGSVLPTEAHPEVTVKTGGGSTVHNGVAVIAGTDFTDAAFVGSSAITKSFTVTNSGSGTLKLSGLTAPAGYKVVDGLVASLATGQSDTFSIALTTAKAGTFGGNVTFKTNVVGDEAFAFAVTGTVMAGRTAGGIFSITSKSTAADKTFVDDLGNKVVLALTGAGTVTVDQSESGGLNYLALSGTDIKSALTVTVTKNAKIGTSMGVTTIGHVGVEGALGSFVAGSLNVTEGFDATGAVKVLTLNNVGGEGQQMVNIGGSGADKLAVTLGSVREVTFATTSTVTSFKALEWLDMDKTGDVLSAFSLGGLTISGRAKSAALPAVAGDLMADITLTQGDFVKTAPVTGSITVAGKVEADWSLGVHKLGTATVKGGAMGHWEANGGFGSVSIGGNAQAVSIQTSKDVGAVTIKGEALGFAVRAQGSLAGVTVGQLAELFEITVGGKSGAITVGSTREGAIDVLGDLASFTSKNAVSGMQLNVRGTLGSVSAASWDRGSLGGAGKVNAVTIKGNVTDGVWDAQKGFGAVTIGGDVTDLSVDSAKDLTSIKAGRVKNLELDVDGTVGSVTVVDWEGGLIHAGKVGSITTTGRASMKVAGVPTPIAAVAGDFEADLFITGISEQAGAVSLGPVSIKGDATGNGLSMSDVVEADWTVFGGVGAIKIGGTARGLVLDTRFKGVINKGNMGHVASLSAGAIFGVKVDVAGKLGAVTTGRADSSSVSATGDVASFTSKGEVEELTLMSDANLGAVTSQNWLGGAISADKVASITTKGLAGSASAGDFFAKVNVSGEGVGSKAAALGAVTIAGSLVNSQVLVGGNVGLVSVGAMDHSVLFAGVNPAVDPTGLPISKAQFTVLDSKTGGLSTLAGFTVTGKGYGASEATFVNSRVAAGTLTNVSLKRVDTGEEDVNGFVAGVKIGAYSRLTGLAKPNDMVKIVNKTLGGVFDPAGGDGEVGYSLRIVV
jgi:hypothetical protein